MTAAYTTLVHVSIYTQRSNINVYVFTQKNNAPKNTRIKTHQTIQQETHFYIFTNNITFTHVTLAKE